MEELRFLIKAKDLELAEKEEDLKACRQTKEALTLEMSKIIEELESTQMRIRKLLQEKDTLKKKVRLRGAEIALLELKNSSIVSVKEEEIANYQKQLKSIRQELEEEKKKISPLQEELQRKRVEVAEKMKDIQYLTEARDRANSELEREREKTEQKSKELAAAAISHAVCTAEFHVCDTCNLMVYMSVHYFPICYRCS